MLSGTLRNTLSAHLHQRAISSHLSSRIALFSRSRAVTPRFIAPPLSSAIQHHAFSTAVKTDQSGLSSSMISPSAPFVSTTSRKYQYFTNVEVTPSGVAIIKFDNPTKKVNTLSFSVMREAQSLWNEVAANPSVKSVVFTSAKDSCFIAGADIFDISSVQDKSTLVPVIEEALNFFLKMRERGVPMVAAIHGPALGGGLEWGEWEFIECGWRAFLYIKLWALLGWNRLL